MMQRIPFHSACVAGAVAATMLTCGLSGAADFRAVNLAEPKQWRPAEGELLPTGMRITPEAAKPASFESLNPNLPQFPNYRAGQAVDTAISPNGDTMLVLTSGYNRLNDEGGERIEEASNEYVFVYDVSRGKPKKVQVLQVPNTYNGVTWNPARQEFYVSGGVDDNVHIYSNAGGAWAEDGMPIELGHEAGLGVGVAPLAAGVAVNSSGNRLLVVNLENDSVSLIDLDLRVEVAEQDLRPGIIDPGKAGVAGGEFPFGVVFKGDDKAYVSSQRDREIVVLSIEDDVLSVTGRIETDGQPNHLVLNAAGTRLYAASDNSDTVDVVDTEADEIIEQISTTALESIFPNEKGFKGSNPNNLALSPDEESLFVTNGGTNSVAFVELGAIALDPALAEARSADAAEEDSLQQHSEVVGLVPTGWYPNAVSVSADGEWLYAVNGKDQAGPNPGGCTDNLSEDEDASAECSGRNLYVWQLEKAGLLAMPMPDAQQLAELTWQVAANSNFPSVEDHNKHAQLMGFLRDQIEHVIYIVKENRTYDQVHGDLEVGNGDPSLAILSPYAPNHQEWARQFVTLDNFYDSGETSNTGWNWTTAARTTDYTEKSSPVNYAGRGLTYDWEGTNRNVNVAYQDLAKRQLSNPAVPFDPDLLPGTADVAAPDGPESEVEENEAGTGYLWDAVLRAGLSVRNYGFYGDLSRYFLEGDDPNFIPLVQDPFAQGSVQFYPTKQSLMNVTDPYFRGYDMKYPDLWRYQEWEREFDQYVANGNLPNLSLVRMPHDHFGDFDTAAAGVNTIETQMADNDYATALLVEKIANSPYAHNTLIFIIEDDAQAGGDHVDAHRSIGYVVGPYVKQNAVVSEHYTTVSMLRTIEDVLGMQPMGLNDGLAEPMADVFDRNQVEWDYKAIVPDVLRTTELTLPPEAAVASIAAVDYPVCLDQPQRNAAYWTRAMRGQDFRVEDNLNTARFNHALWAGLKGEDEPYPAFRHGRDMRDGRQALLTRHEARVRQACSSQVAKR